MGYNKIIYGNQVLIDLTPDTITPEMLQKDATAHDKSGEPIVGTSTKDSDTSDATMTVAELLAGQTGYARGVKLTGTMPDNGGISEEITKKDDSIVVPLGFHDGSGTVTIAEVERDKLIPANIKQGITILNVPGAYTGEGAKLQSKTATPATTVQTIQPDSGYDGLGSVEIKAIPYVETGNSAGGTTVTIGA